MTTVETLGTVTWLPRISASVSGRPSICIGALEELMMTDVLGSVDRTCLALVNRRLLRLGFLALLLLG